MAIVFKTSIDPSGIEPGLKRIESRVQQTSRRVYSEMEFASTVRKLNSAGGGGHGGARGIGDAINLLTGGQGAVSELSALQGSLKTTAGMAVGILGLAKAFEYLHDSIAKSKEAIDAAEKAIGKFRPNITAGGPEATTGQMNENTKLIQGLKDADTGPSRFVDAITMGDKQVKNLRAQRELQEANYDLQRQQVDAIKKRTSETENSLGLSNKDFKLLENRQKLEDQINSIKAKQSPLQNALIKQAEAEAAMRNSQIEHEERVSDRDFNYQKRILEIKEKGRDVEDETLRTKIKFAQIGMDESSNKDEWKKYQLEREQAKSDLAEQQKTRQDKIKGEMKGDRIARERKEDDADTQNFKDQVQLRKQRSEEQSRMNKRRTEEGLRGEMEMAHDLGEQLSDERKKGIARSQMSSHERGQLKRNERAEKRAEERYDKLHPGDRERIRDARIREKDAKNKLARIEADVSQKSIDALTAAIAQLVVK